jgi:hypothetical protein
MTKTFEELSKHIRSTSPHKIQPGRESLYSIPNMLEKGQELLQAGSKPGEMGEAGIDEGEDLEGQPEADDIVVELQ